MYQNIEKELVWITLFIQSSYISNKKNWPLFNYTFSFFLFKPWMNVSMYIYMYCIPLIYSILLCKIFFVQSDITRESKVHCVCTNLFGRRKKIYFISIYCIEVNFIKKKEEQEVILFLVCQMNFYNNVLVWM